MGIFSKIANFVTGGSAEVAVEIDNATLKEPFRAKISASIHNDDLNMERVYLLIRCVEEKQEEFKAEENQSITDNERILRDMNEWDREVIYKKELNVADKMVLKSGSKYNWESTVDLAGAEFPSKKEDKHHILWQIQAGIDVPGNDPDSGWIEFDVK
ncbi:MAG: hypothetical protein OEY34_10170 [Cyclobacteriaceae bacterium]|nr:hypothetical protein [Cyclobacteriaceae bacterium]